jgi:hypothetical protein
MTWLSIASFFHYPLLSMALNPCTSTVVNRLSKLLVLMLLYIISNQPACAMPPQKKAWHPHCTAWWITLANGCWNGKWCFVMSHRQLL